MKAFLKGAAKIAVGLVLAVVVLVVLGFVWNSVKESRERAKAEPLAAVKAWEIGDAAALSLKISGRTKLVDGLLYGDFRFDGFPAYLRRPSNWADGKGITLVFYDADGFKLHDKLIPMSAFSRMVDGKGEPGGLGYEFKEFMAVDTYARISRVGVQWTLDTSAPIETADALPFEKPKLDHCAPRLSRAERLKRLAQYGTVRETGMDSFSAADRGVTFLSGGEVLSCH